MKFIRWSGCRPNEAVKLLKKFKDERGKLIEPVKATSQLSKGEKDDKNLYPDDIPPDVTHVAVLRPSQTKTSKPYTWMFREDEKDKDAYKCLMDA